MTASLVPAAPERSVMNAVVYESAGRLRPVLPRLLDAYERAGIEAWCVWVPLGEPEATAALMDAGHTLDASPAAMIRTLDGVEPPDSAALERWTREGDPAVVARLNDRSYEFGTDSFARAISQLPTDEAHLYVASLGGAPVSCVVSSDHDRNCEIDLVATVPEARGRGIARALLARALVDARERGCSTTTLVATKLGRPVYDRLGYGSLGTIEMWERRLPA